MKTITGSATHPRKCRFKAPAVLGALLTLSFPLQAHKQNTAVFDFYEIGYQTYGFDSASPTAAPLTPTLPGKSAGDMIMISSKLVQWDQRDNPDAPVLATKHGVCTFVSDPHVYLEYPNPLANGATRPEPGTVPNYTMRCEETITWLRNNDTGPYFIDQVQLEGLVDQEGFEAGLPSPVSVIGGTGMYEGATGSAVVTQIIFPNIKRVQLQFQY